MRIVKKLLFSVLIMLVLVNAAVVEACATATITEREADLVLPSALTEIGDEAFMYTDATVIYLRGNVTSIGERAFAECHSLQKIRIPASVTYIDDSAFENCSEDMVIYGVAKSEAQSFANRKGFRFTLEDDGDILLPEI